MSIVQSIELFTALNLIVIGISHFLQAKIWIELFEYLYRKGNVGNIFNAILALSMGTIILSFHFIWTWPMVLVTLYGLAQLLKGFIYLTFPAVGIKSIGSVQHNTKKFRWAGLLMSGFGIFLFVKLALAGAFI